MSSITLYLGLDYHLDFVQVCLLDRDGQRLVNRKVDNDAAAIATVVAETVLQVGDEDTRIKAAIEACSGAANLADELIRRFNWSVTLAHPGIVNRMKQNPDKSDASDAFILADLMRLNYLPKVWLASEDVRQLRSLTRFRTQKVKQQTRVKLRLRALLRELRITSPEGVNAWTQAWFDWYRRLPLPETMAFLRDSHLKELQRIQEDIKEIERRLERLVVNDAVVAKLRSIEGIGRITAITMRAEIDCFDRFQSGKQLSRYCGVTPRNDSSGKRQATAGLVKAGNPGLRTVLIQAAHRLMNFDPDWKAFACRLKERGKPHNVVVAAVANRWLRRLYHQMQPAELLSL